MKMHLHRLGKLERTFSPLFSCCKIVLASTWNDGLFKPVICMFLNRVQDSLRLDATSFPYRRRGVQQSRGRSWHFETPILHEGDPFLLSMVNGGIACVR